MADGLQQQVDEHSQLLGLATCQEAQNDGGPGGGAGLPLKLTASFSTETAVQHPVTKTAKKQESMRENQNLALFYCQGKNGN